MPNLRLPVGSRRLPDLHAAAAAGEAAIALYEWSEHAKWGRFLHDLEGELLVARSEEMARPHTGVAPDASAAAEASDAESREEPDAESGEEPS
jgi:hypothetical protein